MANPSPKKKTPRQAVSHSPRKPLGEREIALEVLSRIEAENGYASRILEQAFAAHPELDGRGRSFVTRLVYSVLTYDRRIDCLIDGYSKKPASALEPEIRRILELAVAQLVFMDKVPAHAAVSEAVDQAAAVHRYTAGYVNAVLREMARQNFRESWPDRASDPVAHWGVRTSLPDWMIALWLEGYGKERMRQIAEALCVPRRLSVRVNTLKTTPDALAARLKERLGDEAVRPGLYLPEALQLDAPGDVMQIPEFTEGLFTIQDESSMLAVRALDPQPGDRVLDVCAAPGGKSTCIAERMRNIGSVEACDIYPAKLRKIEENAARLGTSIVKAGLRNALEPACEERGAYDRVLLDAPCSGLGVLRNKPDMKRSRKREDIPVLARQGLEMLRKTAPLVKPGGVLVYSTCTLSPEENERVVDAFLAENKEFSAENAARCLRPYPEEACGRYTTVFPEKEGLDGFFMARLVREE